MLSALFPCLLTCHVGIDFGSDAHALSATTRESDSDTGVLFYACYTYLSLPLVIPPGHASTQPKVRASEMSRL